MSAHFPFVFRCTRMLILLLMITLGAFPVFSTAKSYSVYGFDVSHHQGQITWSKIPRHQYQFVYIKATEGGDYEDPKFQDNWLNAREHGFRTGAYHFYRLCTAGRVQAEHFIATVPNKINALPPVIDLEYDTICIQKYSRAQLLREIQIMHDLLKQHYRKQPIFYTSENFYHIVLQGQFLHTPLWIRHYQADEPQLKDQRSWFLWQYSKQGRIPGILGMVDVNVYRSTQDHWQSYLQYLDHQELSHP